MVNPFNAATALTSFEWFGKGTERADNSKIGCPGLDADELDVRTA